MKKTTKLFSYSYPFIPHFLFYLSLNIVLILKYYALQNYMFDLGNFDQAIYYLRHWQLPINTAYGVHTVRLAAHLEPILLLIAPFYFLIKTPIFLLWLQATSLFVGSILLFAIGKKVTKNPQISWLVSIFYLLCTANLKALLWEFHPETLSFCLVPAIFYFYLKKSPLKTLLCLLLLALCKESMALLALFLAAWLFWQKFCPQKMFWFGLAMVFYLLFYFCQIAPYFSPYGSNLFLASEGIVKKENRFVFQWLGNSGRQIITTLLFHPGKVLARFLGQRSWYYFGSLFSHFFFLPLLSSFAWVAGPVLALNVLADKPEMQTLGYHYHSAIMPVIFIAFLLILPKALNLFRARSKKYALSVAILINVVFVVINLFDFFSFGLKYFSTPRNRNRYLLSEIKRIMPTSASLSVQNNLGPHFSQRKELFLFPLGIGQAEYVLLQPLDPFHQQDMFTCLACIDPLTSVDEYFSKILELKNNPDYQLVFHQGGFLLYQRTN